MKFNCLCFCLLALLLGAGAAAGQGMSLFQSMDMTGGAFSEDFVNSLFGIGSGASSAASGPWFGPEFENSSSASSFFSEFYINTSIPVISGFAPVKFDVTHKMPSRIYFGSGQEVLYTQYQSAMAASRGNELWIQKGADWSQYAIVPAGTGMQFIAFTPAGGQADYYELTPNEFSERNRQAFEFLLRLQQPELHGGQSRPAHSRSSCSTISPATPSL